MSRSLEDVLAGLEPSRRKRIEERFVQLVGEQAAAFKLGLLAGRPSAKREFAAEQLDYLANSIARRVRGGEA